MVRQSRFVSCKFMACVKLLDLGQKRCYCVVGDLLRVGQWSGGRATGLWGCLEF